MISFEVYAVVPGPVHRTWALVGNPSRLPEWTDATTVEGPPEPPYQVGQRFVTVDGGHRRGWVILTTDEHLLEAKTDDIRSGRLGIGFRVVGDPLGSRLIVAGLLDPYDPGGTDSGWRRLRKTTVARLVHVPRIRSRFDRWTANAVKLLSA